MNAASPFATTALPALFVPHGAPTFVLEPGKAGAALRACADALPRPRAIIVISAHWQRPQATLSTAQELETIYDFYGFPDALYQLKYPAKNDATLVSEVAAALRIEGLEVAVDKQRGLDHGAWTPLMMMYPQADVPVIPLSLPTTAPDALRLGQALAPLRANGYLVVASGNITHNLRDYQLALAGQADLSYIDEFSAWVHERLTAQDTAALTDYRTLAPQAVRAHPTDEHLLPLLVAYGAGGANVGKTSVARFYAGINDQVINMDAYAFGGAPTQ